jgi:uncharacterized membrane protein
LAITLIFIFTIGVFVWKIYGEAPYWTIYLMAGYAPMVYLLASGNFGKMGMKAKSEKRDHHLG